MSESTNRQRCEYYRVLRGRRAFIRIAVTAHFAMKRDGNFATSSTLWPTGFYQLHVVFCLFFIH